MSLESIRFKNGKLHILDQLQLPKKTVYEEIKTVEDGWNAIKSMKVRGAPAIAMVGCLSLAVDLENQSFELTDDVLNYVEKKLEYLITARPTAVNMMKTANELLDYSKHLALEMPETESLKRTIIERIEYFLKKDIKDNESIGEHGSKHIMNNPKCVKNEEKVNVLTHCNTGSLATAGYGTALGVIRSLHTKGFVEHAYCTETRPYNQGARLTAYELIHEKIPATLIADSMAALLMKSKPISAVIVGADRVARNGDTANKIGTYQLAVAAKYHDIPFYVAAPFSSIDHDTEHGDHIEIEHRPPEELLSIHGVQIAAEGIGCWNPSFDVTPYELLTGGIITEHGVFNKEEILEKLTNGY
ncbi:methylthioribose-1-phosphate isomerase-like [Styela clava]